MSVIYEGLKPIGKALGCHSQTIWRYIHYKDFPACKAPNGNYIISSTLLEQWKGIGPRMIVYESLEAIGEVMGRGPHTISAWIQKHGFPAAKTPKGTWITTSSLIDQWILARREVGKERKLSRSRGRDQAEGSLPRAVSGDSRSLTEDQA